MSVTVQEDFVVQGVIVGGIRGYELNVMTDVSLRRTPCLDSLSLYFSWQGGNASM